MDSPMSKKNFEIEVVVETPKGCRNKFTYDASDGSIRLSSVLPAGMSFPYDFGCIPNTKEEDGDPLDVLLLMDAPAFPGCRVKARLIGIIEAEVNEGSQVVRNDRILAVAIAANDYAELKAMKDVDKNLLNEIEQFFVSYNQVRGKDFRILGTHGRRRARHLMESRTKRKSLRAS
ncbi:inorganic diphosphatase [bacterium]|nr:inorganic diphosphatase [bacterium]